MAPTLHAAVLLPVRILGLAAWRLWCFSVCSLERCCFVFVVCTIPDCARSRALHTAVHLAKHVHASSAHDHHAMVKSNLSFAQMSSQVGCQRHLVLLQTLHDCAPRLLLTLRTYMHWRTHSSPIRVLPQLLQDLSQAHRMVPPPPSRH